MYRTSFLLLLAVLLVLSTGCVERPSPPISEPAVPVVESSAVEASAESFAVSGTGVHYFSTAVIHAQEPTETGMRQRSTDVILLEGDLNGYVLYHPTTVIDTVSGRLVNTGTQVFSGTIAGSEPVLLHDDAFRFEVDLATGATRGEVHLRRSDDAPHPERWYECDLVAVGTGRTPQGDNLTDYTGTCTLRENTVGR